MPIGLYMDVHVPQAITFQLRSRGVDVTTAWEDGTTKLDDEQLLIRSSKLSRPLFTQDIRFKALAEQWQLQGRPFGGLSSATNWGQQSDVLFRTSNSSPRLPIPPIG